MDAERTHTRRDTDRRPPLYSTQPPRITTHTNSDHIEFYARRALHPDHHLLLDARARALEAFGRLGMQARRSLQEAEAAAAAAGGAGAGAGGSKRLRAKVC